MSEKKRNDRLSDINSLLEAVLKNRGIASKLKKYQTWTIWDEVVGPQISRHAQPLRIRDTTLEVRVDHATWMQQLQLLKPKIVKELNKRLGDNCITDIYWKRGQIEQPTTKTEPPPPPLPPLPDEKKQEIRKMAGNIDDPELKRRLESLMALDERHKLRAKEEDSA